MVGGIKVGITARRDLKTAGSPADSPHGGHVAEKRSTTGAHLPRRGQDVNRSRVTVTILDFTRYGRLAAAKAQFSWVKPQGIGSLRQNALRPPRCGTNLA